MESTPFRWLGYTRVSTDEQAESGLGMAAQLANITATVQHTPGHVLVEVIADPGQSGKSLNRPGIQRALDMLAKGDADGIVVAKLDRLSRRVADVIALSEWFAASGCALRALDLGIDSSTPSGRMMLNVMASFGQWEREQIGERTRVALQAKVDRGEGIGRPSIYDQPELRARILAMRGEGMTLQAIADALTAEGVPTSRGAKVWRVSSVQVAVGYKRPAKPGEASLLPKPGRRRQRRSVNAS